MIDQHSNERVSGPLHVIKLYDKKIKVQLQYHSPPKKELKMKITEINLHPINDKQKNETVKLKKIRHLNSQKSLRNKIYKQSPYFYEKTIQECPNLLGQYEQFHKRMIENESQPRKLKVYSNSKELKAVKQKQSKDLTMRDNNINKQNYILKGEIPVRKIKLYSPNKKPSRQSNLEKENILKSSINIKLHEVISPKGEFRATPDKDRKHKLQVTSSKSRNKHDSMLSNKEQRSLEISKQLRQKHQQDTPERHLNSFNSSSLNQRERMKL